MKATIDIDIKKAREWLAKNTNHKKVYDMTPEQVKFALMYELFDMGVSLIETKTEVNEHKFQLCELYSLIK